MVKNLSASAGDTGDSGLIPGARTSPGGGIEPTPIFLPGKSHEQRRLVGYSPQCHKEVDTTKHAHTHIRPGPQNEVLLSSSTRQSRVPL